jgi:hypothetical protein
MTDAPKKKRPDRSRGSRGPLSPAAVLGDQGGASLLNGGVQQHHTSSAQRVTGL